MPDNNLLVVIHPAVEFSVFDEARPRERHLADTTVQTVLVPAQIYDPHEKPVFYRPAAACTDLALCARHPS